jgi:hypothetical protein
MTKQYKHDISDLYGEYICDNGHFLRIRERPKHIPQVYDGTVFMDDVRNSICPACGCNLIKKGEEMKKKAKGIKIKTGGESLAKANLRDNPPVRKMKRKGKKNK